MTLANGSIIANSNAAAAQSPSSTAWPKDQMGSIRMASLTPPRARQDTLGRNAWPMAILHRSKNSAGCQRS